MNRKFIGIDSNKEYLDLAIKRYKDHRKKFLLYSPRKKTELTKYI